MVLGRDQHIQFVGRVDDALVVLLPLGGAGRGLHEGGFGDVVHHQLPGFVVREFRRQAAEQRQPLPAGGRRCGDIRPVHRHRAQLHQEGVPGVALVWPQGGEGTHRIVLIHQRGVHSWQGSLCVGAAGPVEAYARFG